MKKQNLWQRLKRLALTFISILLIASACDEKGSFVNEQETITTVTITLTPEEGNAVVLNWDDINLDAVVDDSEVSVSDSLLPKTRYAAVVQLLNKHETPASDVTKEILREGKQHIVCFTVTTVKVAITNRDKDSNGLPVGITSTWTTTTKSGGSVNVTLRHQPGLKTGDCPGYGDTDRSITFPVGVKK